MPAGRDPAAGEQPVRDAATVVLVRRTDAGPQVLMGQRGRAAVFMPDKFVFPGGALDPGDLELAGDSELEEASARLLAVGTPPAIARALPLAAVRELWEETGLRLGRPDPGAAAEPVPAPWRGFFAAGLRPHTAPLRFVFRAVTPPGGTRRFDARFFLADAAELPDPHDDFAAAGGELRDLQWLDLDAARALPLPRITEIVLSEIEALLAAPGVARPVPYFHQTAAGSQFGLL